VEMNVALNEKAQVGNGVVEDDVFNIRFCRLYIHICRRQLVGS
jgi:hypothetical protein